MLRRLAAPVLVLLVLVGATGCLRLDAEITVHEDETLSGTLTLAMSKKALAAFEEVSAGIGAQGSDELVDDEFFVVERLPEGASLTTFEDGGFRGQTLTFEEVELDELMASLETGPGSWTLTRDGDRLVLEGAADFTSQRSEEVAELGLGLEELLEEADMRISVTFPDEVVEADGEIDGSTVTWRPEFGTPTTLRAVAQSPSSFAWWWGVGGVLAVLLLGVPAVLAVRQRRTGRPEREPEPVA